MNPTIGFDHGAGGGVSGDYVGYPTTLPTSSYTHVVAVYDSSMMHIYVNGAESPNSPQAASKSIGTLTGVFLMLAADSTDNNAFVGYLDEVAIYDHALTAARIAVHYNVGTGH
jgi:hypothetical protein